MLELIAQIKDLWRRYGRQLLDVSNRVLKSLKIEPRHKPQSLGEEPLRFAYL